MYKILIADDEEAVRDLLIKSIRASTVKAEIIAAADGAETLRLAEELKPDILVIDIAMPFYDGLAVIGMLQEKGMKSINVIISGYDEFDYAKKAIALGVTDYLLKPFLPKELNEVLETIVEELDRQRIFQDNMNLLKEQAENHNRVVRERFFKKLLRGEVETIDMVDDAVQEYYPEGMFYCAGILRLQSPTWDFHMQEQVEEFLLLVKTGYFTTEIKQYFVSLDGNLLSAVWWGCAGSERSFRDLIKIGLEKINISLEKYYHIRMNCAIGNTYSSITQVKDSYQEALQEWRGSLDRSQPVKLFQEDPDTMISPAAKQQISDSKKQLYTAVQVGSQETARQILDQLMDRYASLPKRRTDYINVSLGELIYKLSNEMVYRDFIDQELEIGKALKERIRYGDLSEIKNLLSQFVTQCCQIVGDSEEKNRTETIVRQLVHLVDTNLGNSDIDLEWVSARLHFSTGYIRKIFKQKMGEGYGEYLIRKRMELAGRLLQQTEMQIHSVARECGYDNQRYFASSFKRFYGCTPTEFKKYVAKNRIY